MNKADSLILLVNSMSKAEKKNFYLHTSVTLGEKNYLMLFQLIDRQGVQTSTLLKQLFCERFPEASFSGVCGYLYHFILNVLSDMRRSRDVNFYLMQGLMYVRVLYEKSLYSECFRELEGVMEEAKKKENHYILLLAQRLELDYMLSVGLYNIDESTLLSKQHHLNGTLKIIRRTNEQAALYELLKHRIEHRGSVRSLRDREYLNDLVVSEMSVVAGFGFENFEIKKLHQLFQAHYLISVGDYKSALNSFYQLNLLFEQNSHLLNNPPIYYLMVLEGVLESLRYIKKFDEMDYFLERLQNLTSSSTNFQLDVVCVIFLYKLFYFIDNNIAVQSLPLIAEYQETLIDKKSMLNPERQAQLSLYVAIVYLQTRNYKNARKMLSGIISNKTLNELPLYRTIRLVNLMIYFELGDFEYIAPETRSIKRTLSGDKQSYRIEKLLLKLLNIDLSIMPLFKRREMWQWIEVILKEIRNDKFESQLLRLFDFTYWIETKFGIKENF